MILLLSLLINFAYGAELNLPEYHHPITDQQKVVSSDNLQKYNQFLEKLYQSGGPQVGVLIIDSLSGIPLEEYSIKLAEKWKLGTEKQDNGVILLLSLKDHKFRIEVGQGLEGTLTDLDSRRITAAMVPLLKENKTEAAILMGIDKIIEKTSKDESLRAEAVGREKQAELPWGTIILLGLFLYIVIAVISRDPFWGFLLLQVLTSGGGGSGGDSDSSGGGGGFSGGGNSSSW